MPRASGVDTLALRSSLGGNVDHMSSFPEDFNHLVNEARAEQARAEAGRRAAAAAAEARRREIRELSQLAKQLAAKATAAHVKPRNSVLISGEKTAMWRKRASDRSFSGWEVYRWTHRSSADVPSYPSYFLDDTYSVLLTTEGLLLAFRHRITPWEPPGSFRAIKHSLITGTEAEDKDGQPILMLFGAEVEAMSIKKGLADFAARFLSP